MENVVSRAGFVMYESVLLFQWDRLLPYQTVSDVCEKAGETSPLLQLHEQQRGGEQQTLLLSFPRSASSVVPPLSCKACGFA